MFQAVPWLQNSTIMEPFKTLFSKMGKLEINLYGCSIYTFFGSHENRLTFARIM